MKNLTLNRLAPISNPKESACAPFYSETNLIKVLSSFPDHFVPVENFFKTGLKQNNQLVQTKKIFADQPCSKGTFLLYLDKIYTKKSCIYYSIFYSIVYLLQCICYYVKQISSFIYVFTGEIYGKLKNIHLQKPPSISKKNVVEESCSEKFVKISQDFFNRGQAIKISRLVTLVCALWWKFSNEFSEKNQKTSEQLSS